MFIKQLYTNCLSHAAYYIESNGEAVIIDPLADVQEYIDLASSRNTKIKYILETHFHADFVSGHIQLAEKTGAEIVFGSKAKPDYQVKLMDDEAIIPLGDITLKVLHTPGHTLESVTYLLMDESGKQKAIFTGDTLFLGDVGRPDLSSGNLSSEELASLMYDSLTKKILPLSEDITIYPGHGAGSACGKKLSNATSSTLAEQKKSNYALRAPNKETFIKEVTEGMKKPPAYFFSVAKENQSGPSNFTTESPELSADSIIEHQKNGVLLIDSRAKEEFVKEYIPGSINIGLSGRFAPWVGAIIPPNTKLIVIAKPDQIQETLIRLARVGYKDILGVYSKGIPQWKEQGYSIESIPVVQQNNAKTIIDVRTEEEFGGTSIENIKNIPIEKITENIDNLQNHNITLACASGYRAVIAASLLKEKGLKDISVSIPAS